MRHRIALTAITIAAAALAQEDIRMETLMQEETVPPPISHRTGLPPLRSGVAPQGKTYALAPLDPAQRDASNPDKAGAIRRLGGEAMGAGGWEPMQGGSRVWQVTLRSPGAAFVKVHFRNFNAGTGNVWIFGADAGPAQTQSFDGPYTDSGRNKGDFWTRSIRGDSAIIAYEPPTPSAGFDAPPFEISAVGHIWLGDDLAAATSTVSDPGKGTRAGIPLDHPQISRAASCHLDSTCASRNATPASAVARIIVPTEEGLATCSGAVLNNAAGRNVFLTANHCISSAEQAADTEFWWFFQTDACNGRQLDSRFVTTNGSRLLAASAGMTDGDFALVEMLEAPPSGVARLGWRSGDLLLGSRVYGIHHPNGSYKRISYGQRIANGSEETGWSRHGLFYAIEMSQGRLEGGSSGSPVFDAAGYVVGLLSNGPVAAKADPERGCRMNPFIVGYSRFSALFPKVRGLLADDTKPIVMGQTAYGSLSMASGRRSGCIDCYSNRYRLQVTATSVVDIRMWSGAFDTYLTLLNGDSRRIEENDDETPDTTNSRILRRLTPGAYFIEAGSYRPSEQGTFALSVRGAVQR